MEIVGFLITIGILGFIYLIGIALISLGKSKRKTVAMRRETLTGVDLREYNESPMSQRGVMSIGVGVVMIIMNTILAISIIMFSLQGLG